MKIDVPLLIGGVDIEVEDELGNKFLDIRGQFQQEPLWIGLTYIKITQFQLQNWL